jgi:hypothetical protein
MPRNCNRLALHYRDYPDIKPIRTAVHPNLRQCTLFRVDPSKAHGLPVSATGLASLNPEHLKKHGVPAEFIVQERVDAFTLMEIIEDSGLNHLDLLQIDTEGFDAEVVKMINFDKIRPSIIKYEVRHLSDVDASTTEALLKSHDYKLFNEGGDKIAVLST